MDLLEHHPYTLYRLLQTPGGMLIVPSMFLVCSTHGVEGSSSRQYHYIPGRAQAHLSHAAYCWASWGYKADLSDCYVLCQR